jgi:hypothetical protein
MFMRKVLVSALFAAGTIAAVATPLSSSAQIYLQIAPPAPRYEAAPTPRDGYVWSNGHWQYDGSRHVWAEGEWQSARPGYVYSQPRWVENNGRWGYQSSRWDRDGDGVSNRNDSAPNNPRRN